MEKSASLLTTHVRWKTNVIDETDLTEGYLEFHWQHLSDRSNRAHFDDTKYLAYCRRQFGDRTCLTHICISVSLTYVSLPSCVGIFHWNCSICHLHCTDGGSFTANYELIKKKNIFAASFRLAHSCLLPPQYIASGPIPTAFPPTDLDKAAIHIGDVDYGGESNVCANDIKKGYKVHTLCATQYDKKYTEWLQLIGLEPDAAIMYLPGKESISPSSQELSIFLIFQVRKGVLGGTNVGIAMEGMSVTTCLWWWKGRSVGKSNSFQKKLGTLLCYQSQNEAPGIFWWDIWKVSSWYMNQTFEKFSFVIWPKYFSPLKVFHIFNFLNWEFYRQEAITVWATHISVQLYFLYNLCQ